MEMVKVIYDCMYLFYTCSSRKIVWLFNYVYCIPNLSPNLQSKGIKYAITGHWIHQGWKREYKYLTKRLVLKGFINKFVFLLIATLIWHCYYLSVELLSFLDPFQKSRQYPKQYINLALPLVFLPYYLEEFIDKSIKDRELMD